MEVKKQVLNTRQNYVSGLVVNVLSFTVCLIFIGQKKNCKVFLFFHFTEGETFSTLCSHECIIY